MVQQSARPAETSLHAIIPEERVKPARAAADGIDVNLFEEIERRVSRVIGTPRSAGRWLMNDGSRVHVECSPGAVLVRITKAGECTRLIQVRSEPDLEEVSTALSDFVLSTHLGPLPG